MSEPTQEEIDAAVQDLLDDMPAVAIFLRSCTECGVLVGCMMGSDPPTCGMHN